MQNKIQGKLYILGILERKKTFNFGTKINISLSHKFLICCTGTTNQKFVFIRDLKGYMLCDLRGYDFMHLYIPTLSITLLCIKGLFTVALLQLPCHSHP